MNLAHMNIQASIDILKTLRAIQSIQDDCFKSISSVFGQSDYESPFGFKMTSLFNMSLNITMISTGIPKESLEWFIYDNDWGKNGLEVKMKDDPEMTVIDSIESFVNFESRLK